MKRIYIAIAGPFTGYMGTLTNIAGITHLKSADLNDDWNYVMVANSQIEYLCMAEV